MGQTVEEIMKKYVGNYVRIYNPHIGRPVLGKVECLVGAYFILRPTLVDESSPQGKRLRIEEMLPSLIHAGECQLIEPIRKDYLDEIIASQAR